MGTSLVGIFLKCAGLAASAVGGAMALLPSIEHQNWTTPADLAQLAAIAQSAPGPNMLLITLIGWRSASLPGAIVATLGFCLPSALVIIMLYGRWHSLSASRWRNAAQTALAPLAVGMVLSGALAFLALSRISFWSVAIMIVVAAVNLRTKVPPVFLIAAGAIAGLRLLA
jgi:chromate transporter